MNLSDFRESILGEWIYLIVESPTEVSLSDFRESNFGGSLWF